MGRTIVAMVAGLALLLSACGGGGDEGVADQPQEPAGQTEAGQEAAETGPDAGQAADPGATGDEVAVQGFRFQPSTLQVAAGATVTWMNEDDINHTATAGTPDAPTGDFDVDLPQKGATGEHTFDEPGTYAYFCEVHPSMTGEIVVS